MEKMDERQKRGAFATAILCNVVDMLGLTFLLPVFVPMAKYIGASNQVTASFTLVRGVFQLMSTLWLGAFSDRTSRRLAVIVSLCGSFVAYFVQALAPGFRNEEWFGWGAGIVLFMIGRVFAGFFGGSGPVLAAFVSEVYADDPAEQKQKLVLLQASQQVFGIALSPIAGSIARFNLALPFWLAVVASVLGIVWAVAFFPAGRPKTQSSEVLVDARPVTLKSPWADPRVLLLAAVFVVFGTQMVGAIGLLLPNLLYGKDSFGLNQGSDEENGQGIAQVLGFLRLPQGLAGIIVAVSLFGRITERFGNAGPIFVSGLIVSCVWPLYGYATAVWHLYVLQGVVGLTFGMIMPSIAPMMSRYSEALYPQQKAQVQAAPMSGMAVGMMVGMNLAAYLQEVMGLTDVWLVIGGMQLVTSILMVLCSVSVERAISRHSALVTTTPQEIVGQDVVAEQSAAGASDIAASGMCLTSFHTAGGRFRRASADSTVEFRQRLSEKP